MSTLHTINRSPSSALLESCASLLEDGDGILFIEDGIYHCTDDSSLARFDASVKTYALSEDLAARGMLDKAAANTESVNYTGFVQLCCDYDKVISWF